MLAADTEVGLFFIAANGVPTFQNRYYRLNATPVATLDEDDYETPETSLDDELVFNEAQVSAGADAPFIVTDADSIAEFGPRTISKTIYPADSNEAYDHANYLLGLYANPSLRLGRLAFRVTQVAPIAVLLGAELSDLYTVDMPLAGDDLSLDVFLEQITHTIDLSKRWMVEWQMSPAAAEEQFWLLGVAGFSELGDTTVLGF
jgi:hypothetical protein